MNSGGVENTGTQFGVARMPSVIPRVRYTSYRNPQPDDGGGTRERRMRAKPLVASVSPFSSLQQAAPTRRSLEEPRTCETQEWHV